MNEHTKLLIMKAGGIICSTEGSAVVDKIDYLHFDAEKFAELIVNECAQFVEDKFDFCGDEIIIAEEVRKHFGVEL